MKLEFCAWKDIYKANRKFFPCGHIYSKDGLLRLEFYSKPHNEYILAEEEKPKNSLQLFSIQCVHPYIYQGENRNRFEKIGIVRTTNQKGTFINLNDSPHVSYKLIDPEYKFLEPLS